MNKYSSATSFADACNNDKERIKQAFNRKIAVGEDGNGFIYDDCTKEEAEKFILSAYDEAVHQAFMCMASSIAHETIMRNHGLNISLTEYNAVMGTIDVGKDYEYEEENE